MGASLTGCWALGHVVVLTLLGIAVQHQLGDADGRRPRAAPILTAADPFA
ncbi:hypothetical protein [Kitasatospora sp. NPDC088346]